MYYIGTMDADEVFTISVVVLSTDPLQSSSQGGSNISFVAEFKNGDTWHQSEPYITTYSPPVNDAGSNNNLLLLAIGLLALLAAGGFLYRKRLSKGGGAGKGPA